MAEPTPAAFVGEWSGTYKLWLEPDVLRIEGPTRATGRPVIADRVVALDYTWTDLDGPQQGSYLIRRTDEGTWEGALVDSWHTGSSIMVCAPGAGAEIIASYGPAEAPWGWRTTFALTSPDELVISAWNVEPSGEETRATEAVYRRAR